MKPDAATTSPRTPREVPVLPGWPLMLRRELAAAYCGMSPSTFDVERKAGRVPRPIAITPTMEAWHVEDLRAWAEDRRAAQDAPSNEWDADP